MKIIEIQGGLGNQLFLYTFWKWMQKKFPDETIYGVYPSRALAAHNGLEIEKWFDVSMPPVSLSSNIIGETCFWLNKILRRLHLPIPYCSDDTNPKPDALFHDGYFQDLKYQEGVIMPSFRDDLSLDENNKKILEKYRAQWQQEVCKLQDMATKFEDRPIRKLKLKPKHQNNNE